MMRLRAAVALGCAITARAQLPQILEEAMDHVHPRARAELARLLQRAYARCGGAKRRVEAGSYAKHLVEELAPSVDGAAGVVDGKTATSRSAALCERRIVS